MVCAMGTVQSQVGYWRYYASRTRGSLFKKARAILNGKRGSDWGKDKQQEVQDGTEDYCEQAEAVFMFNLMEHILGETRKDTKLSKDEVEQECNWIEAAWEKEYLRVAD